MSEARTSDPAGQVVDLVDTNTLVEFAREMVRIPSQIPNEGALAQLLAAEMRRGGGYDEVIVQQVVEGRPNVIGIVRGRGGGRTLLLNGHLDIPKPLGQWTRDPYDPAIEEGWLYGLGLTDMKAGVACIVKAGEAVGRARLRPLGDLIVTAVIHHDVCGLGTKFFLASNDRRIDMAINAEPTDLKLQVAHGGAWQFELVTHGRAAHVSRHETGVDAIAKMFKLLSALDKLQLTFDPAQALEGLPRLLVGYLQAGESPSRTAERCVARGDVRIVPGMTADSVKRDFETVIQRLAAEDPDFHAEVRGLVYQRPFRVEPEAPVVQLVARAHQIVTSREPEVSRGLPVAGYITDSSDIVRYGIPTVVYGPGDWKPDPDERIRIADMATATRVYARVAAQVITQPAV